MTTRSPFRIAATVTVAVLFAGVETADADEHGGVPDFRHLQVTNPAQLSMDETERVYDRIKADQYAAYAASGSKSAIAFPGWRRYNSTPYLSSTHGNRYVNNFANELAAGYESLKKGDTMPVGAAFAKDSFAVTDTGEVMAGRLFVMEKLDPGQSPKTDDWRYIFIETDGRVLGDSHGNNPMGAAFCHTCHKVRSNRDFLFFVPDAFVGN